MKTEQAIQIIKEAIHIAISKGCYGLVETTNIVKALEVLDNQPTFELGEIEEVTK
jgi:hypothetical protein